MNQKSTEVIKLKPHIENILKERYYLKAENSWTQISKRLSSIHLPMYDYISKREFIPSTPTIMNLNTNGERNGTLSSCFILGIKDSIVDIMDSMREAALVTKAAGGVGYDWSKLRGSNENVKSISANSGGVMAFIGIFDAVLDGVRQGGKRRGAGMSMLSIYHPNILTFIDAKAGDTKKYTRSNFSVRPDNKFYEVLRKTPDRLFKTRNVVDGKENVLKDDSGKEYTYKMLWDKLIHNAWASAEPGIFNGELAVERCTCKHITDEVYSNPCLTGDTLVYVADGRGNVSIKTLADEGKDVDVFSMDYNGAVVVKRMMNPRLTQKNAKVFKVKFDSGMEINATENHEFINTDGKRIQVKDLKGGESIKSVIKHEMSIGEAHFNKKETKLSNKGSYYFIENNGNLEAEHRILASTFHENIYGNVVHHKNFNSLDNSKDNLVVMTYAEHKTLHSSKMKGKLNPVHRIKDKLKWKNKISITVSGVNNPNSDGATNEEIVRLIKRHSKTTVFNLMCKSECLKINEFPNLNTSTGNKYRLSSFDEYCNLADVRYVAGNVYKKLESQAKDLSNNYNYHLNDNTLEIEIDKKCEHCDNKFMTGYENRHVTYCSHSCLAKDKFKPFMFSNGKLSNKYLSNKNIQRRLEKTLEVVNTFKQNKYANFKKQYKLANSIIRPNNVFCPSVKYLEQHSNKIFTTKDLVSIAERNIDSFLNKKEAAKSIGKSFNHKVISVEYVGIEDVYDGTVDDTHTILIGGTPFTNKWGRTSYEYVVTGNCSEYVHIPYTSCNLGSINLAQFVDVVNKTVDWKRLEIITEEATVYLNGIIDNNSYPVQKIHDETHAVRPIGLGMMGLAHLFYKLGIPYDSDKACELTKNISRYITLVSMRKSMNLAKTFGKTYKYYDYNVFMDANKRFFTEDTFMGIDIVQLKADIKKYGVHNSCFTSIAPTGTISYIADTSSGIEPVFGLVFTRKIEKENKSYEHVYIVDPVFEEYIETNHQKDKEFIYQYIALHNGSCQGCPLFLTKEEQATFRIAGDITPMGHLKVLAEVANNISLSVSKTINLPNNCSEKEVGEVFLKAQELGIIGVTVYRDGSREGILVHNDNKSKFVISKTQAVKRPDDVKGELHLFTIGKHKYYTAIGLDDEGNPYEVFTGFNEGKKDEVFTEPEKGIIKKMKRGDYIFIGEDKEKFSLTNGHSDDSADVITRSLSWGLRHGGGIEHAVHQIEKTSGPMTSFSKVLARTLKKYIKDNTLISGEVCPTCNSKLIRVEGCAKCASPTCGYSKCS